MKMKNIHIHIYYYCKNLIPWLIYINLINNVNDLNFKMIALIVVSVKFKCIIGFLRLNEKLFFASINL